MVTFLPIVWRELRVAARRAGTYSGRLRAALLPILLAGGWLMIFAEQFNAGQGQLLFSVLSTLAFAYCLLAGAWTTSDCLSWEKREGTLGLLLLTHLQPYDILLGKLASSSLSSLYGLLGTVPVLSLAFLLGGVTPGEVIRMAVVFVNTLFLSLAAGICVSALSRSDRRAMFGTACLVGVVVSWPLVCAALYVAAEWYLTGRPPQTPWVVSVIVSFSPAFAFYGVLTGSKGGPLVLHFGLAQAATQMYAWFLLGLAGVLLPYTARERAGSVRTAWWRSLQNRWIYGRAERRAAFRKRLLDRNAFFWLAARDRVKVAYVWCCLGAVLLIWLFCGWVNNGLIVDGDIVIWLILIFFGFIKVWLVGEVCTRFSADRMAGAFELLLSSPLSVREVARGQSRALVAQFGWPLLVAIGAGGILMESAARAAHENFSGAEVRLIYGSVVVMLIFDLVTLKWVAIHQSLRLTRVTRAIVACCVRVLLLPGALFVFVFSLILLTNQGGGGTPRIDGLWFLGCFLWLAIGLLNDLYFGLNARRTVLHRFREFVSEPFHLHNPKPRVSWREVARAFSQRVSRNRLPAENRPPFGLAARHRALAVGLIVIMALVGALIWHRQSLRAQVNARLAAIRAAGQPVTMAELRSWTTPPVPAENAGFLLAQAARLTAPPKPPPGRRGIWNLEWPGRSEPLDPVQRRSVEEWLGQNGEALALLHQAAKLSRSSYPVDWRYGEPDLVYWQSFHQLQPCLRLLQFDALLNSDATNVNPAIESVNALLGAARALAQESNLAAQFYRDLSLRLGLLALERVLNQHHLEPWTLSAIQSQLEQAADETGPALTRGFLGERCFALDHFEYSKLVRSASASPPTAVQRLLFNAKCFVARQLGIPERTTLDTLDILDALIAHSHLVNDPVLLAATRFNVGLRTPPNSGLRPELGQLLMAHQPRFDDALDIAARLRVAASVLAIERYRATHGGERPSELDQLVPGLLTAVPLDPFSLRPLSYHAEKGPGYFVYSVGPDRTDNHGAERNPRRSSQPWDIVFKVGR